jgi:hypothetical protein
MGEYWLAVNIDKGEHLDPYDLGGGYKWAGWDEPGSYILRAIGALHASGRWALDDEVRAVSDYTGARHLSGKRTERPASFEEPGKNVSAEAVGAGATKDEGPTG